MTDIQPLLTAIQDRNLDRVGYLLDETPNGIAVARREVLPVVDTDTAIWFWRQIHGENFSHWAELAVGTITDLLLKQGMEPGIDFSRAVEGDISVLLVTPGVQLELASMLKVEILSSARVVVRVMAAA
jgi:hypothetical protein